MTGFCKKLEECCRSINCEGRVGLKRGHLRRINPTCAYSGVVGGLSVGGAVALPDRVPLLNRPDGADKAGFPSVRLTFSPVRFPCLKYGIANDEGVSNVVFIDFETTERIVLPSPLT